MITFLVTSWQYSKVMCRLLFSIYLHCSSIVKEIRSELKIRRWWFFKMFFITSLLYSSDESLCIWIVCDCRKLESLARCVRNVECVILCKRVTITQKSLAVICTCVCVYVCGLKLILTILLSISSGCGSPNWVWDGGSWKGTLRDVEVEAVRTLTPICFLLCAKSTSQVLHPSCDCRKL